MSTPRNPPSSRTAAAARPLKRPRQARARFTVQAIYDAFVRIWQRDGWDRLTTRNVALETGIAVGTLYDYFPNKTALLSGYVRHCIEALLAAIDREAVQPAGLPGDRGVGRRRADLHGGEGVRRAEASLAHRLQDGDQAA